MVRNGSEVLFHHSPLNYSSPPPPRGHPSCPKEIPLSPDLSASFRVGFGRRLWLRSGVELGCLVHDLGRLQVGARLLRFARLHERGWNILYDSVARSLQSFGHLHRVQVRAQLTRRRDAAEYAHSVSNKTPGTGKDSSNSRLSFGVLNVLEEHTLDINGLKDRF